MYKLTDTQKATIANIGGNVDAIPSFRRVNAGEFRSVDGRFTLLKSNGRFAVLADGKTVSYSMTVSGGIYQVALFLADKI